MDRFSVQYGGGYKQVYDKDDVEKEIERLRKEYNDIIQEYLSEILHLRKEKEWLKRKAIVLKYNGNMYFEPLKEIEEKLIKEMQQVLKEE